MSTEGFTRVWNMTIDGIARTRSTPRPTDALELLLERFYDEAVTRPPNTRRLCASIGRLLEHLSSSEGRTHDNLWVASNFLMPGDDYWEVDWADLPQPIVEILCRMGHEMWQAVEEPELTKNFDSLPEQLLAQLKTYEADYAG